MATGVYMPIWGLQMEEATLVKWLVEEGTAVSKGQGLAVVETYKIAGEVESPSDGVLRRQVGQAGKIYKVGALLAVIGAADEDEAEIEKMVQEEPFVTGLEVTKPKDADSAAAPPPESGPAESPPGVAAKQPLRATPLARRIAKEKGIDLALVKGSGENGRIMRRDVEAAPAGVARAAVSPAQDKVIPLSSLRRAIINKTMQTVDIPYGALSRKVRLDRLLAFKQELAGPFERKYGLKLALTHIFFKAVAIALEEAPELNSTLDDENIIQRGAKNIGMVVTPPGGGGIMIPVVRDVQAKSLDQIARDWAALSDRVQRGAQTLDDLSGGTFTISNVGPAGIDVFTPVIHPPESAILGISRLVEEPVVAEGEIIIAKTLSLIVGADHRVFDADPIGVFLTAMDRLFQNPGELLI
ncbi:MAG: dihydrolipoamide acetyltransferase family protein [Desulfarculaceae bacterium]|jgi:pyruvate dehydrogenase E2 component (dihydrolipoamide acetyltransferase)